MIAKSETYNSNLRRRERPSPAGIALATSKIDESEAALRRDGGLEVVASILRTEV